MRAFLAGVIGAVVSTAAWVMLEHVQQASYFWLVLVIGMVTGVCVHRASGSNLEGATARGALALALTLLAIVGGRQAYARYMSATVLATSSVARQPLANAPETEEPTDEAEAVVVEPLPVMAEERGGEYKVPLYSVPTKRDGISELDIAWLCLAALLAYITGKGTGSSAAAAPSEEAPPEPTETSEESAD